KAAGLAIDPRETKTLGVAGVDYDGGGRAGLYFINDPGRNRLFRNRRGGTFGEGTDETGSGAFGGHPPPGLGAAVGDPFGDGRSSLFVTNFGGEPNSFYRNVEGSLFEDAGASTGTAQIGFPFVRWGTHFADFDNDGWPDLYAVGGHLAPRIVRIGGRYKSGKTAHVRAGDNRVAQKTRLPRTTRQGRVRERAHT